MSGARSGTFDWHPEPELIDVRDPAVSRAALERLGHDAWAAALDYLYGEALRRGMGEPTTAATFRAVFFGERGGPALAPVDPVPSGVLLSEFRDRLAPHQLNAWHPRTLSYFTPPPLLLSIVGELLAEFTQQGVDVWHAGPSAAFVEEEVVRGCATSLATGRGSFGLLTSGGVMANFMALVLARDVRLRSFSASIDRRGVGRWTGPVSMCPTRVTSPRRVHWTNWTSRPRHSSRCHPMTDFGFGYRRSRTLSLRTARMA